MTFWKLTYHIIWGTKNKQPLITSSIEAHLYPFIVSRAANMNAYIYQVNGWYDHIHIIASVPPKYAIADFVKDLKGASSYFINRRNLSEEHFAWQRGYGVLSLGEKQRPFAEKYVINQKEHHAAQTTNSWLEKMDEDEKRPFTPKSSAEINESSPIYNIIEIDYPF